MTSLTLSATLDDENRLVVQLPPEIIGHVTEVIFSPPLSGLEILHAAGLLLDPDEIEIEAEIDLPAWKPIRLSGKSIQQDLFEEREERL